MNESFLEKRLKRSAAPFHPLFLVLSYPLVVSTTPDTAIVLWDSGVTSCLGFATRTQADMARAKADVSAMLRRRLREVSALQTDIGKMQKRQALLGTAWDQKARHRWLSHALPDAHAHADSTLACGEEEQSRGYSEKAGGTQWFAGRW